jgi:hypothetical protein
MVVFGLIGVTTNPAAAGRMNTNHDRLLPNQSPYEFVFIRVHWWLNAGLFSGGSQIPAVKDSNTRKPCDRSFPRYHGEMGSATFVEEFKDGLRFTPVEGRPNLYFIHAGPEPNHSAKIETTNEEWDKFESDIAAAFEQVP